MLEATLKTFQKLKIIPKELNKMYYSLCLKIKWINIVEGERTEKKLYEIRKRLTTKV